MVRARKPNLVDEPISAEQSCPIAEYDESKALTLGAGLRGCAEHDLVRKGTGKKGRYLIVLPLHISIEQGGNMGTLRRMDTAHPQLVIPTADGNLELEGSFVNTTTRYLVCNCQPSKEFSTCEHVFNQLLVFNDPILRPAASEPPSTIEMTADTTANEEVAETKEKDVDPCAPFYGSSERTSFKYSKRRSSAIGGGAPRKRTSTESSTASTAQKKRRRKSDTSSDDDSDEASNDMGASPVRTASGADPARRQSLRASRPVNYAIVIDDDDDEEEEGNVNHEEGSEGDVVAVEEDDDEEESEYSEEG